MMKHTNHYSVLLSVCVGRKEKKVWLERLQFTIEWIQQKMEDKNLSKESERKIKMGTDKGWWLEGSFDCNQHIISFRITTRWHTGKSSLVFLKISSLIFLTRFFLQDIVIMPISVWGQETFNQVGKKIDSFSWTRF